MKFCHIAPTAYIEPLNLHRSSSQLLLAHLVERDKKYTNLFADTAATRDVTILDNSAFELYQEGKPMFAPEKMVELGKKVKADYLVLPDYPGEHSSKTIERGLEFADEFRAEGFGTFFVPQSQVGDLEDYISCFAWAASNPNIDYIGLSILGNPNAFGVYKNPYQQFLARPSMMAMLEERGLLTLAKTNGKKIHLLGMTDGPNEIAYVGRFASVIDTWDSSAAVWAGICDVGFDNSPTGLRNGKVQSHVDFDAALDKSKLDLICKNINVINNMVETWTKVTSLGITTAKT